MRFSIYLFDFEKAVIFFSFIVCAVEYMRLPASQYSVLDAERIERVNDDTFRCYVYRFKFFNFEVCPVLLVKVEQQPDGCCIKLLSCKVSNLLDVLLNVVFYRVHLFRYFDYLLSRLVTARRITDGCCTERQV